jgi:adenylate cyclase
MTVVSDGSEGLSRLQALGVFDPDATDAADQRVVLGWLLAEGYPESDIVRAVRTGTLSAVVPDLAVRPGPRLSAAEAVAASGLAPEMVDELRRAAGLAPSADVTGWARADVDTLRTFAASRALFTDAELLGFTRVLGSSLARIADAANSLFLVDVENPLRTAGASQFSIARKSLEAMGLLDAVVGIMGNLFRAHMEDSLTRTRRSREGVEDVYTSRMAIGFVDIVGFTSLAERVTMGELDLVVRDFERRAYDVVAEHGGRVVKLIGDEVMFVSSDPAAACVAAQALVRSFHRAGSGPAVVPRGGLAYGSVLARSGDVYGPLVNLASRIAELAVPNELLVTTELAAAAPAFHYEAAGRRMLKGIAEPVSLLSLVTEPDDSDPPRLLGA